MNNHILILSREVLLVLISVLGSVSCLADDFSKEYVVKAAISLNLVRFTEWPSIKQEADVQRLNICVFGGQKIQEAFAQMENKTAGKRLIHVMILERPSAIDVCHVIYVSAMERNTMIKLLSSISGQPKMTIGEHFDFLALGGQVNLEMAEDKINIKVNLDAVKRSGIIISSRVLALTTIVHDTEAKKD